MSLMHVSVSVCHEMLNPVMLFNWCCAILLGNCLSLFRNSVIKILITTTLKLLSVHVNEKDSIQACGVFIKLGSEKYKMHSNTAQHLSGILMPIIRSLETAVAASGLPLERGGSSVVGRIVNKTW